MAFVGRNLFVTFGSSGVLQIDLRELGASRAAKPLLRHVATTGLASVARIVVPTPADDSGAFLVGVDDAGVVTYGGLDVPSTDRAASFSVGASMRADSRVGAFPVGGVTRPLPPLRRQGKRRT